MAWNSQGEQIRQTLKDYATQLEPDKKKSLEDYYDKAFAPSRGEWQELRGVTYVTLKTREHVLENVSLSVFKEMMGLGPLHYCVLRSYNRDFESLLLLALHYLPKAKFCMYPEEETLAGPFLHSPWSSLGREICNRPTISIEAHLEYLGMRARQSAQQ